jgi:hypothetical protein
MTKARARLSASGIFRIGKLPVNAQAQVYYNIVKPDGIGEWAARPSGAVPVPEVDVPYRIDESVSLRRRREWGLLPPARTRGSMRFGWRDFSNQHVKGGTSHA